MSDLALELIPLAVAIALSPFPLVPVVLLLLTGRPLANGFGFLAGWFGGLTLLAAVFSLVAGAVELWDEAPSWAGWTRLVLGLALIALGVRGWLTRGGSPLEAPAWMSAIGDYTPTKAGRLGLLLAVANPKSLLLVLAGGVAIGSAELGPGRSIATILLFSAAAASTVALPVLLRMVLGERIVRPLENARGWLIENNDAVVAVVMIVIGVIVARNGWTAL